jgi:hypothetical protein
MALILTPHVHEFREAARHLWNSYMRRDTTWDTVEEFAKVAEILFSQCVLGRARVAARPIPMDCSAEVLTEYRVFADHKGRLPLRANRDIPASGFWDFPVAWIPPEGKQVIYPICFFDFDQIAWRGIQYYRVRIVERSSHPDLNGRDALIECTSVDLEVRDAEPAAAADRGRNRH